MEEECVVDDWGGYLFNCLQEFISQGKEQKNVNFRIYVIVSILYNKYH